MLGAAGAVAAVLGAFAAGSLASDAGLFSPAVFFWGAFLGRAAAAVVFVAVFFARVVFLGLASSSFCAKWGSRSRCRGCEERDRELTKSLSESTLNAKSLSSSLLIVRSVVAKSGKNTTNTNTAKKEKTQQKRKKKKKTLQMRLTNANTERAMLLSGTQHRRETGGNGQPQMPERDETLPRDREREGGSLSFINRQSWQQHSCHAG